MSVSIRRALISVSDKTGLGEFAHELARLGIEVISTGGTAIFLRDAGLAVTDVSQVTGFPEIMDGRVKTLHPKIHGGLLALRDDPAHRQAMAAHDITGIDLLVINFYPFERVSAEENGQDMAAVIEAIDIGGPAMTRAAAKNHRHVAVVADPEDYAAVARELRETEGQIRQETREALAAKAFSRTAAYDAAISEWLCAKQGITAPKWRSLAGVLRQEMRYGENPHQRAAFYAVPGDRAGVGAARQLQGKPLSYNNVNDADAAFECVNEFSPEVAACVIVKHANPCGVAVRSRLVEAYRAALACDRDSAFGGVVAFNRALDRETASELAGLFTEVVIAPGASPEAAALLARRENLRLLLAEASGIARNGSAASERFAVKTVRGGFLVQSLDNGAVSSADLQIVTHRAPDESELRDLLFAMKVAKHVKSNAIVYARDEMTVGIGAGQMSRVEAARIAGRKYAHWHENENLGNRLSPAKSLAVASDAFFPFADGLTEAIAAGATAVIQPGGSRRDAEVIEAANKAGIAMVFTGMRHFRH